MSSWAVPVASDFKALFNRDFPYAPEKDPDNLDFITDADITRAINDAVLDFNNCIFGDSATTVFLYLAAYHLVQNIQASMKGLAASAQFVSNNTSVGGVSVGNMVVGSLAENPILAKYLKNAYGQKYIELALPYLIGNVRVSEGGTTDA